MIDSQEVTKIIQRDLEYPSMVTTYIIRAQYLNQDK